MITRTVGEEVRETLRSDHPLDRLIVNHTLPGTLPDPNLLAFSAKQRPALRTMVLTSLPPPLPVRHSYQVLLKPFSVEELTQAIEVA